MENRLLLSSPDASSKNLDKCPTPLQPQVSTQEHHKVLHNEQNMKVKQEADNLKNIKVKQEGPCVIIDDDDDDEPSKEEEIPLAISTGRRDTRVTRRNIKPQVDEGNLKIKKEANTPQISTGPGGTRETQREVKVKHEERQPKAKRKFLEIGIDGRYTWYSMEKCSDNENVEEDITAYMTKERALLPKFQPVYYKEEKPYSCPECGKGFTHEKYFIIHYRSHTGEKPYYCSECGKSFSQSGTLNRHKLTHADAGGYYCPECGQRFPTAWFLAAHRKIHSSENVQR